MKTVIRADGRMAEILIYQQIGTDWWGDGLSAKSFAEDLQALGELDEIKLLINSPGGDVFDGMAIYNTLLRHQARKIVEIDGLAASIASIIAMVGDEIRIGENAMLMIHDPWSVAVGTASEFRQQADVLDAITEQLVATYAARSKQDRQQIREWMAAETWMSGAEALERGFADSVTPAKQVQARFDRRWFRNAPSGFGTDGSRSKAAPSRWRLEAAKRHLDLMSKSA